jgi:hypothetical protein
MRLARQSSCMNFIPSRWIFKISLDFNCTRRSTHNRLCYWLEGCCVGCDAIWCQKWTTHLSEGNNQSVSWVHWCIHENISWWLWAKTHYGVNKKLSHLTIFDTYETLIYHGGLYPTISLYCEIGANMNKLINNWSTFSHCNILSQCYNYNRNTKE